MLKKLIVYDFRCQWKLATALSAISLLAAIASSICYQFGMNLLNNAGEDDIAKGLFGMGLMLAFFFALLLAIIAASAVILAVGVHYYKKFVSDEAYLTFTLPATQGQHLTAKMISGSVWMGISVLVMLVDLLIVYIPIMMDIYGMGEMIATEEVVYFSSLLETILTGIGYVLMTAVSVVSQVALLYLSLTVGGILSQKHKAVAGVGIYLGADFVIGGLIQTITTVVSMIVGAATAAAGQIDWLLVLIPYIDTVVFAGFTAAFILINKHLLTKKLNLA